MTPERIINNFTRCGDWEERYLYLIELGQRLPPYPKDKMDDSHLVKGCQSQVWLTIWVEDSHIMFDAASDTVIVKGLIALIRIAFHGKASSQVIAFDLDTWFEQLGLKTHLTPARQQGVYAMVNTIREFARGASYEAS